MPHTEVLLDRLLPIPFVQPTCQEQVFRLVRLSTSRLPIGPLLNFTTFPLAGRVREDSASLCRCLGSSRGPAEWEEGHSRRKDRAGGAKGGVKDRRGPVWKGEKKRGEPEGGTAPTKLLGTKDERGGSGEGYLIPEPPVHSVWRRSCGKVNSAGENSCRLSNTRSPRRGP